MTAGFEWAYEDNSQTAFVPAAFIRVIILLNPASVIRHYADFTAARTRGRQDKVSAGGQPIINAIIILIDPLLHVDLIRNPIGGKICTCGTDARIRRACRSRIAN